MWKDFFYFSRSEKQGIIVLVVLICVLASGSIAWSVYRRSQEPIYAEQIEEEYNRFLASLEKIEKEERLARERRNVRYTSAKENIPVQLAPFDPNTADSITFRQLGLPAWMAGNVIRYRDKGGMFRVAEDFRKIYGLSEEQYTTLLPYIRIGEVYKERKRVPVAERLTSATPDSLLPFKYIEGTVIGLNSADTTDLKKVPGIGSALAKRIVGYRQRLGGFYTIEQLQEINLNVEELANWFTIEAGETTRINLNKVGIERLKAHPYFNFYQAKVIVEHRKRKGNLKSLNQIAFYEEFSKDDLERIKHYVCFE